MTAKQIKFFGTKRQRAALKANRAKKRKSSASSHRPRTKPKAKHNPAPKKKRRSTARKSSAPRKKAKANKPKRKNLSGIFALTGNPARGGSMATTKKKKRKSSAARKSTNAGYSHKKKKNTGHRRRSSNPGQFGGPMEWITGGVGAVIGGVGAPALTQLAMGASNTGPMGYLGNAVAVALLAAAAHFAAPRQKFLAMGIVFGGAGSIIRRVIGDYSLLGSYSSQVGMGDYLMNFNYPIPQYLQPGNNRTLVPYGGAPAAIPVNANAAPAGMGSSLYGSRLY